MLYINSPILLILLPVNSKEVSLQIIPRGKNRRIAYFFPTLSYRSQYRQLYSDDGVATIFTALCCFVATIFTVHYYFNHINSSGIVLEYAGKDLPGFGRQV